MLLKHPNMARLCLAEQGFNPSKCYSNNRVQSTSPRLPFVSTLLSATQTRVWDRDSTSHSSCFNPSKCYSNKSELPTTLTRKIVSTLLSATQTTEVVNPVEEKIKVSTLLSATQTSMSMANKKKENMVSTLLSATQT